MTIPCVFKFVSFAWNKYKILYQNMFIIHICNWFSMMLYTLIWKWSMYHLMEGVPSQSLKGIQLSICSKIPSKILISGIFFLSGLYMIIFANSWHVINAKILKVGNFRNCRLFFVLRMGIMFNLKRLDVSNGVELYYKPNISHIPRDTSSPSI